MPAGWCLDEPPSCTGFSIAKPLVCLLVQPGITGLGFLESIPAARSWILLLSSVSLWRIHFQLRSREFCSHIPSQSGAIPRSVYGVDLCGRRERWGRHSTTLDWIDPAPSTLTDVAAVPHHCKVDVTGIGISALATQPSDLCARSRLHRGSALRSFARLQQTLAPHSPKSGGCERRRICSTLVVLWLAAAYRQFCGDGDRPELADKRPRILRSVSS